MTIIHVLLIIGCNLASAAFLYGKLTNEVTNHKSAITELRLGFTDHETRISHLEGAKGLAR